MRIKNEDIVRNIMSIADELKFQIDENAAYSIAQRGTGSMRDALSSLDKVYSMGLSSVSIDDVNEILGLSGNEAIFKIVQNLIEKDLKGAIINYRELIKRGVKADFVVERLAEHYGKLLTGKFAFPRLSAFFISRFVYAASFSDAISASKAVCLFGST